MGVKIKSFNESGIKRFRTNLSKITTGITNGIEEDILDNTLKAMLRLKKRYLKQSGK